ncbi:hypothetical protein [Pseudoblastomonas halimionae]|uniref:Uncharacterized protein n=1 Tax=Alteriqipengyuania halimionae TaxID=1926630 RepID=A0A6I4U3X6_9SPHN|nr:hypothetical protein [Alteriqipengyuania halimionae]MXP10809.1 hypothetical protein [Alteriqipengyuania halimionae]
MAANVEAIAAVNHWRGQCLDNFARAEKAIIATLGELAKSNDGVRIHEAAAHRTRGLCQALKQISKAPPAARAAASLETWALREKQRNHLAHGCFTVRAHCSQDWAFVNEVTEVRKNIATTSRTPWTKLEADAFLKSIIVERKNLEALLKQALAEV